MLLLQLVVSWTSSCIPKSLFWGANDLIYLFKLQHSAMPFFHARVHKVTPYKYIQQNQRHIAYNTMQLAKRWVVPANDVPVNGIVNLHFNALHHWNSAFTKHCIFTCINASVQETTFYIGSSNIDTTYV